MKIAVVTLFPEMFAAVTGYGVSGRAVKRGLLDLECINPREFTQDVHRTVDDRPYGGGPGMVMMVQPLLDAVKEAKNRMGEGAAPRVIYMSPQGVPFSQAIAERLSKETHLVFVAGRYEGVDERFITLAVDEEISVGDYVLSGGELPAMTVVDAVARLLPGALGHADSAAEDSFSAGLLDCPHYTRPESLGDQAVPPVLLSGNHAAIQRWRLKQALGRTSMRRPDLLEGRQMSAEERRLLSEYLGEQKEV